MRYHPGKLKFMMHLSWLPCRWGFHRWVIMAPEPKISGVEATRMLTIEYEEWVQCRQCGKVHPEFIHVVLSEAKELGERLVDDFVEASLRRMQKIYSQMKEAK